MLLTIVFSNHCQLDCAYCCIREKGSSPILSVDDAKSFIMKYKEDGKNTIEFFGGEPTLHWESIKEIMDWANEIGDFHFRIYTNGLFDIKVEDEKYWCEFLEVLVSLDGKYEDNFARRNTKEEYQKILSNIEYLLDIDAQACIAMAIGTSRQFRNLSENIDYFRKLGIRYFSLEVVTVWEDSEIRGLDSSNLESLLKSCTYLLDRTFYSHGIDPHYINLPRELISSDFYFNNKKDGGCNGASCADGVRAISPRGNTFLCRDHAANEEGLLSKNPEWQPIAFYKKDEVINNNPLTIKNNSFDHLKKYDALTPCPVKSIQFIGKESELYWLDKNIQSDIIQPLWKFIDIANKIGLAWAGYTSDVFSEDFYEELIIQYSAWKDMLFKFKDKYDYNS